MKYWPPPVEPAALTSSSGVYCDSVKEEMDGRLAEERGGGGWQGATLGVDKGGVVVVVVVVVVVEAVVAVVVSKFGSGSGSAGCSSALSSLLGSAMQLTAGSL